LVRPNRFLDIGHSFTVRARGLIGEFWAYSVEEVALGDD